MTIRTDKSSTGGTMYRQSDKKARVLRRIIGVILFSLIVVSIFGVVRAEGSNDELNKETMDIYNAATLSVKAVYGDNSDKTQEIIDKLSITDKPDDEEGLDEYQDQINKILEENKIEPFSDDIKLKVINLNPNTLTYSEKKSFAGMWEESNFMDSLMDKWPSAYDWEAEMCSMMYGADMPEGSWTDEPVIVDGMTVNSIYIAGEKSEKLPDRTRLYQLSWIVSIPEGSNDEITFTLYVLGYNDTVENNESEDGGYYDYRSDVTKHDMRKWVINYGEAMKDIDVAGGETYNGFKAKYSNLEMTDFCIEYEINGNDEEQCVPIVPENYEEDYGEYSKRKLTRVISGGGETDEGTALF